MIISDNRLTEIPKMGQQTKDGMLKVIKSGTNDFEIFIENKLLRKVDKSRVVRSYDNSLFRLKILKRMAILPNVPMFYKIKHDLVEIMVTKFSRRCYPPNYSKGNRNIFYHYYPDDIKQIDIILDFVASDKAQLYLTEDLPHDAIAIWVGYVEFEKVYWIKHSYQ